MGTVTVPVICTLSCVFVHDLVQWMVFTYECQVGAKGAMLIMLGPRTVFMGLAVIFIVRKVSRTELCA